MALGDLFYEAKGKITGQRILDTKGPKIETTVSYDGAMKNGGNRVDVGHIATFRSSMGAGEDGAIKTKKLMIIETKEALVTAFTKSFLQLGVFQRYYRDSITSS